MPPQAQPSPPRGLTPGHALPAEVDVPVSKSVAQRALVAAALTAGSTRLVGIERGADGEVVGEDVRAAFGVAAALGAELRFLAPKALTVRGHSPAHAPLPGATLDVGESGTLARLATAIAALCRRGATTVTARGTLLARSSPPLFASLLLAGARLGRETSATADGWPVTVRGLGPPSDLYLRHPVSSQELTALLVVAASYPDPIRVHVEGRVPSAPYVELTKGVLAAFGVTVTEQPGTAGPVPRTTFETLGVLTAPADPLVLDGDASAAAVALTAGAISGQPLFVRGRFSSSHQGDARIVELLGRMGADVSAHADGWRVREGALTRGLDVDLTGEPDLAPPLAVAALAAALRAEGTSRLAGLGTLRGKECDRLTVLAGILRAAGARVELGGSAAAPNLTIAPAPGGSPATSAARAQLDPHGDHRMAFATALAGLVVPGLTCSAPDVVAKSWPAFWSALGAAPRA